MLTAKQRELLIFIQRKLEETGISPSFEEMKDALDLKSKSGVHRLISALEERGFIRRLPNRARALEVLKQPDDVASSRPAVGSDAVSNIVQAPRQAPEAANDVIDVPLHGRIAAGMPIEALEGSQSLPVPAALLGSGEHYALEVKGDSMIDAGIHEGDVVVVKRQSTADNGDIIVALIEENEATLKRLRRKGGAIALEAANPAYGTRLYRSDQVKIQGKMVGLIRTY